MAVLDGAMVSEAAAELGVARQSVHAWLSRYRAAGLAGLADRSSRPRSSPNRASGEVEARVCELRRAYPRWGALRIVPANRVAQAFRGSLTGVRPAAPLIGCGVGTREGPRGVLQLRPRRLLRQQIPERF
jgi:transposase-like protein